MSDTSVPTFYRIVLESPPALQDFASNQARGMVLARPTPETTRWWAGISVFDSEDGARQLLRQRPRLGSYIAEMRVPDDGSVRYERTGNRPGHYTLWAEPAVLLACVVRIVPV